MDTSFQNSDYVTFDSVQKSYDGETLVVKDLNLTVGRGEFLTMLGPSGSGKTTSLMMLAGFESATHGEIRLDGRPINQVPPHKRGIGMVFQNYALFPHMTVGENLAFPLEVRGIGKDERETRIKRALDMVQMGAFANRRPAQLSGGQQQRIALARALVFDPKLVLMDEPLGALDKQLREHMQFEIKHLHESLGITVVYVTHDQGEALTMSDRVAVFNDGRIQQLAPPADLYERPENSFVAQFIGFVVPVEIGLMTLPELFEKHLFTFVQRIETDKNEFLIPEILRIVVLPEFIHHFPKNHPFGGQVFAPQLAAELLIQREQNAPDGNKFFLGFAFNFR